MPIVFYVGLATALGITVAFQPLMNAVLARAIGSPFGAAAISISVAVLGAVAMVAVTGRGEMTRANLAMVPWWVYLAGFIGTLFVAGGVVIAPITGAQLFFISVIAGQLIGATVADHFGLFGLDVRTVSLERLIGLVLVMGGALLVQRG